MRGYNSSRASELFIMGTSTVLINSLVILFLTQLNLKLTKNTIVTLLIIYDVYKVFFMLQYSTLTYYMSKEKLVINYLWGIVKREVSMDSVLGYFERNIPGEYKAIFGYELMSVKLGVFKHDLLGICRLYITNNTNSVFISTDKGYIVISPQEVSDMKYHLNRLNKPEIYLNYYEYNS